MSKVVEMYVWLVVLLALITDETKVVLYGVRDRRISTRTKSLCAWFTSEAMARRRAIDGPIVRSHVTAGMLVGYTMVNHPDMGSSVVLKYGERKYAQRSAT